MTDYKQAYLRHMDSNGITYRNFDEHTVSVSYRCDNISSVTVFVFFDRNGKNLVRFVAGHLVSFRGEKRAPGITLCNDLNARYRWVKFYLDENSELVVQSDAIVDLNNAGSICAEIVSRMVNIIDEAYPAIMKVNLNLS